MSALDKLFKERATAKGKVTLQVNALKILLAKEGEDMQESVEKVDDYLKKLESNFNKFKAAHVKYCEVAEELEAVDGIEKLLEINHVWQCSCIALFKGSQY